MFFDCENRTIETYEKDENGHFVTIVKYQLKDIENDTWITVGLLRTESGKTLEEVRASAKKQYDDIVEITDNLTTKAESHK